MKKILLILMLSYSFAFSVTYHSSWDSLISYQSSNPDSYGNLNINTGSRDSLNNSTFAIPTADISTNGSCPSSVYKNLGGPAYYIFSFNYQSSDGLTCYYSYNYYYQYYDTYPACISPEVFDLDSRTCLVPPPTCDPDTEVLNPDTNLCECASGYMIDPVTNEGCVVDCSLSTPTITVPLGWKSYVNVYNTSEECSSYASSFTSNSSYFDTTIDGTCTYNICSVDEYVRDPCITADRMFFPSGNYIFDGLVDNKLSCTNKVDGVNYINAQTQPVSADCPDNYQYFCYLLPSLDNPDTGLPLPDENSTYSDGSIILDGIPLSDSNRTDVIDNPTDSVSKSNALIGQLTGDFKDYFEWQKTSNGTYEKALTNFGRDFLKGQDTTKMNNDNANTDKIVNAINVAKTDTTGIETKLDTLIGTDTTDKSEEVLSGIGGITDLLTDINISMPSLEDDNSSVLTTDDILSAYDNFETDSISKLTELFDSIDYGVFDMFAVSSYDFVDYPISVSLPMTSIKLEGNLMSADFLNSLDFSLGRLALLLATLVFSVYYVINRLF